MQIEKINFKSRRGKFKFAKGKEGHNEKKLIKESLDVLADKHTNKVLSLNPADRGLKKQAERYEKAKNSIDRLTVVESDQDFESSEYDDESNQLTYNDVCDMITGIHEHLRLLEEQGIGFNSGTEKEREKYSDLRRILSNLGEMRGRLTRTVQHPQGFVRRKISKI